MLSDEEKKALERINYIQDFIIENGQYNADVNDMEYFSKVLNLIEKQSKEIEELKDFITKLQATKDRLDSYDKENTLEIEKLNKEIEELKEENEKYKNPPFFDEENYTSNAKIKAKIEEIDKVLNEDIYVIDGHYDDRYYRYLQDKHILQSLLEKE